MTLRYDAQGKKNLQNSSEMLRQLGNSKLLYGSPFAIFTVMHSADLVDDAVQQLDAANAKLAIAVEALRTISANNAPVQLGYSHIAREALRQIEEEK